MRPVQHRVFQLLFKQFWHIIPTSVASHIHCTHFSGEWKEIKVLIVQSRCHPCSMAQTSRSFQWPRKSWKSAPQKLQTTKELPHSGRRTSHTSYFTTEILQILYCQNILLQTGNPGEQRGDRCPDEPVSRVKAEWLRSGSRSHKRQKV